LHYSTRSRPWPGRPPHIQDKNRTATQQSSIELKLLFLSNTSLDISSTSEILETSQVPSGTQNSIFKNLAAHFVLATETTLRRGNLSSESTKLHFFCLNRYMENAWVALYHHDSLQGQVALLVKVAALAWPPTSHPRQEPHCNTTIIHRNETFFFSNTSLDINSASESLETSRVPSGTRNSVFKYLAAHFVLATKTYCGTAIYHQNQPNCIFPASLDTWRMLG
jgi:hypothetical protein